MGPKTDVALALHVGAAGGALILGVSWLVRPWPSAKGAIWFLAIADVLIGVGGSMMGDPAARLCATLHLAMLGMFAALLLGWRILLLHCMYSLALIGAIALYAAKVDARSWEELYIYAAPAITTVVGLPSMAQVIVEFGRRAITEGVSEWHADALTGLLNRRGMEIAAGRAVERHAGPDSFYVVAMIDLDRFKVYNDTHGHFAGDQLLADVARILQGALSSNLVSRNGGDEFGVFAIRSSRSEADAVVRAITAVAAPRTDSDDGVPPERSGLVRGSVGIAVAPASWRSRLWELAEVADGALYDAKRDRRCPVAVVDVSVP